MSNPPTLAQFHALIQQARENPIITRPPPSSQPDTELFSQFQTWLGSLAGQAAASLRGPALSGPQLPSSSSQAADRSLLTASQGIADRFAPIGAYQSARGSSAPTAAVNTSLPLSPSPQQPFVSQSQPQPSSVQSAFPSLLHSPSIHSQESSGHLPSLSRPIPGVANVPSGSSSPFPSALNRHATHQPFLGRDVLGLNLHTSHANRNRLASASRTLPRSAPLPTRRSSRRGPAVHTPSMAGASTAPPDPFRDCVTVGPDGSSLVRLTVRVYPPRVSLFL